MTWCEGQEGSPPHCGLAALRVDRGLDGLDLCREGPLCLDAAIINPANSGRALGLAFRGIRTASYDFMFGTVRLSAVQDRSRNKRRPHSTPARGTRYEDPNSSHLSRSARKYRSKDRLLVGRTGSPLFCV